MNKDQIKKAITESVLNFLNDVKHWPAGYGFEPFKKNKNKLSVTQHPENNQDETDVEINHSQEEPPIFKKKDDATDNTFILNKEK